MHAFETALSVPADECEWVLSSLGEMPWGEFWLNPRRLRGSDFLMRWSQGTWSEGRMVEAVNATQDFVALPYGPSGVAPTGSVREYELYFERLEAAGLSEVKRPDLLLIAASDWPHVREVVTRLGGLPELPFVPESHRDMQELLNLAFLAVECENSLWKAAQMPDFGAELRPQRRLDGRLGLKKSAVLPTVIVKQEDLGRLTSWQSAAKKQVHIWHSFYDMAFGIGLDKISELISTGLIEPTVQVFQAPGGATSRKTIYKVYHHYAYPLATTLIEPTLSAQHITDKNGHILPYVSFEGGAIKLQEPALVVLRSAAAGGPR